MYVATPSARQAGAPAAARGRRRLADRERDAAAPAIASPASGQVQEPIRRHHVHGERNHVEDHGDGGPGEAEPGGHDGLWWKSKEPPERNDQPDGDCHTEHDEGRFPLGKQPDLQARSKWVGQHRHVPTQRLQRGRQAAQKGLGTGVLDWWCATKCHPAKQSVGDDGQECRGEVAERAARAFLSPGDSAPIRMRRGQPSVAAATSLLRRPRKSAAAEATRQPALPFPPQYATSASRENTAAKTSVLPEIQATDSVSRGASPNMAEPRAAATGWPRPSRPGGRRAPSPRDGRRG